MKQSLNKILQIFLPLVCSVAVLVFTVLCMRNFREGFFYEHASVITSVAVSVEIIYIGTALVFLLKKSQLIYKLMLTGLVLAALLLVGLFLLQVTGILAKITSREALLELIDSTGVWGPLVFIVLQALQVFLLPIPGTLTVGVGAFLFRPLEAFLYSFAGIFIGSIVGFWIGRVIGYKAAAWLVGKESLDKWLEKIKGKDRRILTAMFILPVFPDDVLCFVAGLSTMTWKYFIILQIISRALSVALTSFSIGGNIIPYNTWWGILCWALIGAAIVGLFILIYKKGDEMEAWFFKKFGRKKKAQGEDPETDDKEKN
ncbi:MAG TPA: TVP38/TMEM64 family protein [Candidatus Borkfalkia faecipullorum]|uniref:TVP38/TMEM64 family membrane protein n=1 Tax=Candidatus Borkfalkia faecipullorum TaxID=2838510 RepID=A0A9D1V758_9FIRM|nr:TVP38/TMEM64 family protein [Candidatus Borkfalkia faecipullorum]